MLKLVRAFCLGIGIFLFGCATYIAPRAPNGTTPHLVVMTYNVNFGLAGDPATIDAIKQGDADVIFLQETNEAWEAALRSGLSERYPHMQFRHCCNAGGLAILSKYPFEDKAYVDPVGDGWFPAWVVVVDSPLGEVQVLNVHLRPPLSDSGSVVSGYFSTPPIREKEIKRFHEELDPALPTLVVGDFNESGGDALSFLEERGMISGLKRFDTPQDTWRWNTSIGEVGSQLDHIVHDKRLQPLNVRVLKAGRSDHLPVLGTFQLEGTKGSDRESEP